METLIANTTIEVNEQGYLTNMDQWNEEVANAIATEEGITLTPRHFEVLNYLRDEQRKGTALSIRRVGKSGVVDIKELYELFPGGPLKKSSRIAGIPKPAAVFNLKIPNVMETLEMPVNEQKETKKTLKKVMIINSKATIDSVYAALILANGARMEGFESEIFCTFFGLEMLRPKKMDHLHIATVGNPGMHIPTFIGGLPGMEEMASNMMRKEMDKLDIPPVSEFLEIYKASGGKIFACKLAMDMFKYTEDDLWEGVDEVLTVGDFYMRGQEEGTQIIFI